MAKKRRGGKKAAVKPGVGDVKLYEDALARLQPRVLSTPFLMFDLSMPMEPRLRIDNDEWLTWPLGTDETNHIISTFGNGFLLGLVPASRLSFENSAWHDELEGHVRRTVQDAFLSSGSFTFQLAHLAVDAAGSRESLVPASRPPGTFATLCIALPAWHEGGPPTFGDANEPWYEAPMTKARCVAFLPNTPLVVPKVTLGRCAMLVYHLIRDGPGQLIQDTANALAALAARPSPKMHVFAKALTNASVCSSNLAPLDRATLTALLTSKAYDVVLVEHEEADDGSFTAGIASYAPPHGVEMDAAMHDCIDSLVIQGILFATDELPACSLVFWPKSYRVHKMSLAVLSRAILDASRGTATELYGYASVDDLIVVVLPRFAGSCPDAASTVLDMYTALGLRGRFNILAYFLTTLFHPTRELLEGIGRLLVQDIRVFGWPAMATPLRTMVGRWALTSSTDTAHGYRLVASLAGVADDPVCDAVTAVGITDWIVDAWTFLADGAFVACAPDDIKRAATSLIKHHLQLQAYVAASSVRGRLLYRSLPDVVVAKIASFRGPRYNLDDWLDTGALSTIHDVAPALGVLLQQGHVAVVAPYAEAVVDAFDAGDHGDDAGLSVHEIASLFAVSSLTDRFLDLLDPIADRWRLALAPALLAFFRGWPALAEPWMADEAARYLVSFATDDRAGYVFADNKHNTALYDDEYAVEAFTNPLAIRLNQHYFTGPSATAHTGTHVRVWVALDVLSFLAAFAPAFLSVFAAAWLPLQLRRPKSVRTTLYPVVTRFHDHVGDRKDVFVTLAEATLNALPTPADDDDGVELLDYALPALVPPQACCDTLCAAFAQFLRDPLADEYWGELCASAKRIMRAHPTRLHILPLEHSDWQSCRLVGKIHQAGQLPLVELKERLKRRKTADAERSRVRAVSELMAMARHRG
ncbi:hypothetical protein SPRG_19613 [Saprolegnia parasitica CBS 223.65]|uniref:Uncharacterized protein n=1 Tax=Saprolegnia parasitica (strain CBS 223.65) TaxID=695850 RepID=A0A067CWC3_SAPPC|nr:hypothetical protein SPRG_19613 [Saprolegnia parasitica CBS 223.65]KDO31092.1 hypothetical protein SPRG_19613 [Saprolegnia parasitica CBS 223.65]|eukprot:XP_012198344.1 hypothetical protein SPRG_19613 [Saprolegnia parasitica CBS 223.65]